MKPVAAIHRPAEDLAELAKRINGQQEAILAREQKVKEDYRAIGEELLKAKKQVGHGNWMKWVADNLKNLAYSTVALYMKVARDWDKLLTVRTLREVYGLPTDEPPHATPHSDMLEAWVNRTAGQTFYIETDGGGFKDMVADRDKWNWEQVREGTLPKLEGLHRTLGEYIEELKNAVEEA